MRPLDHKVDTSLCQALSCAEYRFPPVDVLGPEELVLILGLRYGLIGLAANYFVLSPCDPFEQENLLKQLRFFGTMIREHIDMDMCENSRHRILPSQGRIAQGIYAHLFERHCELMRLNCPLDLALSVLVEEFVATNLKRVKKRFFSFAARKSRRAFEIEAQKSLIYALGFFERRRLDLEELPEIALLDE